ncbi:sporulation protein, partial [Tamilnaduibacter salinus]
PEPEPEPVAQADEQSDPAPLSDYASDPHYVPLSELQARDGITVQMIAGYDTSTVQGFVNTYSGVDGWMITRSTRQGRPWYIGLYGDFANRDEARNAIARLPEALKSRDYWVRPLSGL